MIHTTRRRLLGAATLAGLSMPAILRAQGKDPIRIGSALPLTGSQAGYGKDFDTSMRMGAKAVNAAGGIAGRQVEVGDFFDRRGLLHVVFGGRGAGRFDGFVFVVALLGLDQKIDQLGDLARLDVHPHRLGIYAAR